MLTYSNVIVKHIYFQNTTKPLDFHNWQFPTAPVSILMEPALYKSIIIIIIIIIIINKFLNVHIILWWVLEGIKKNLGFTLDGMMSFLLDSWAQFDVSVVAPNNGYLFWECK